MNYVINFAPGVGLGVICERCDGEDRDLVGFYSYFTRMTLDELNEIVEKHEETSHSTTELG